MGDCHPLMQTGTSITCFVRNDNESGCVSRPCLAGTHFYDGELEGLEKEVLSRIETLRPTIPQQRVRCHDRLILARDGPIQC
jgi:hypothetical protein